jgi:hypothetical protein
MKIKISWKLTLIFLAAHCFSYAQSLSPVVISTMGGYYANSTATLSYTVAELSMVKTISSSNNMLTQGFQQPYAILVSVPEIAEPDDAILVFPNPTPATVNIQCKNGISALKSIRIFNITGQQILSWDNKQADSLTEWSCDLSGNSSGLYLVEICCENSDGSLRINYSKINLQY